MSCHLSYSSVASVSVTPSCLGFPATQEQCTRGSFPFSGYRGHSTLLLSSCPLQPHLVICGIPEAATGWIVSTPQNLLLES